MKLVISLGGSMLRLDKIKDYAKVLEDIARDHKVFVVIGGGRIAREYINTARSLGADETFCDYIGILATRLNAMLLISALKSSPKVVPKDFIEAYELSKAYDIIVMGGTFPGHTTDATAALLAEFVNADMLLIATSVDGVYSKDPKAYSDAIKFDRLPASKLVEIVSKSTAKAGSSVVVDLLAAKIIERSKIKTVVFFGEPENILRVVRGEEIGTVIEASS